MRLIDADALEGKVLEWMPSDPCGIEEKEIPFETDIVVSLMMEIEEAPTINIDRPRGEWINDTRYLGWTCSNCNSHEGNATDRYCYYCGAKMKMRGAWK